MSKLIDYLANKFAPERMCPDMVEKCELDDLVDGQVETCVLCWKLALELKEKELEGGKR